MIVCVFIYISHNKLVQNYITSFEYIVRTLIISEKAVAMKIPFYEEEYERLTELRKKLKGVKTSYLSFIKQSNRTGIADMASGMTALLNCFFLIDIFFFYKMLKYVIDNEDAYGEIFAILGKMESQISVANLKASFEDTCVPTFTDEKIIKGVDMIHPLVNNCVPNSFDNSKGMLITGSNASGKSTFLRSVLVNTILSESVYVACAKEFSFRSSKLFSSMSLSDSLGTGESYYMAEINSINRIIKAKESGANVICFLDEVLRGTNTVERVAAATEILKYLTGENIITLAATHDIELTYLLENDYDNHFFREEIRKDDDGKEDIYFSYKINDGRSDTRNALLLLKIKEYPSKIVENAQMLSKGFVDTGKWQYDEG
jgi:DNA mismatch repair ATPase MutS